jgi:hypothetical protein
MKRTISLLMAAGSIAIAPAIAMVTPPSGSPAESHAQAPTAPTTAPAIPQSPTGNGGGYNHQNSPQHATGQPMQSCEDLIASGAGSAPGRAADNGHSAFGGSAGDKYAGSQPQNSRNTASVSQYDTACARPH